MSRRAANPAAAIQAFPPKSQKRLNRLDLIAEEVRKSARQAYDRNEPHASSGPTKCRELPAKWPNRF
jgi:hypothetical protein